jgi:hypothetical protein
LIAVRRTDERGMIREAFRSLQSRRNTKSWQVFTLRAEADDESTETIDPSALAHGERE